ncbi:hypothetical protein MBM_10022 [Drepanopeziza brunnea f. sp. 'multigermtubi' MB_m1]|uniref:Uncharacterized protein n=1 Tax=Marssonina brunnea f. sp. multigermtubi (strain MB_m1) TaxID=1072389 RepID=K1WTA4_MARBU|nr:uncharacterized protein MBM_10022 [Drepanopeziza brunnea f. sp. 'multigermtubi' MB_m1]EKD11828.1 hypothetical protein MBM_10022 [Drepanopeziza brunnea f. sp. 'multigermtubi' MB_m1]
MQLTTFAAGLLALVPCVVAMKQQEGLYCNYGWSNPDAKCCITFGLSEAPYDNLRKGCSIPQGQTFICEGNNGSPVGVGRCVRQLLSISNYDLKGRKLTDDSALDRTTLDKSYKFDET